MRRVLQVPRKQQALLPVELQVPPQLQALPPVELQVPPQLQALPLQQAQRTLAIPVPHRLVQHVFAKALQR